MCQVCGCSGVEQEPVGHADHSRERLIRLEKDILSENDVHARANRERLDALGVLGLNLVSSPGSGKTSLLERTLASLPADVAAAVIEGDQQTSLDADRIRATGVSAVQINTGRGCHLDAHGVGHAIEKLDLPRDAILFIENVGNLVCPAPFDLGEAHKVVILSVTEGDDKPLKYPDMFAAADLMLINKSDLLAHVDFDVERAIGNARRVNRAIQAIVVSARTGEGMDRWMAWVSAARAMRLAASPLREAG